MQSNRTRILRGGSRAAAGIAAAVCAMLADFAAADMAYVGNQGSGTVSVIDTATDSVVRTLPANGKIGEKVQAVLGNRAGTRAFAVDAEGNALVVVDEHSGAVGPRLAVGRAPEGASLSPSGKTIAVCVEDDNMVALVDVATEKVTRKIATQGKNPEHCVFSADERRLLTSNENSNDVDLIDLVQGRSVALIPTTLKPRGIAWLRGQPLAYVAQEGGGVDVIDVGRRALMQSIKTGLRPADAIGSADDRRVFVSNGGDGTVSVIDTATQKVIATIAVGKRPWNMALTHDGKKLYVANGRSNTVSVIDTAALAVVQTIAVGELPWGVSIP